MKAASKLLLPNFAAAGGGFNPETDITWHSLFWAEGTDFVAHGYSDSAKIGTWPNESGEIDATQAGADGVKPSYDAVVPALNDKPAVNFDGNDLLQATFSTGPSSSLVSHVIVGQATTNPVVWCGVSMNNDRPKMFAGSGIGWSMFAGVTLSGSAVDTSPHLLVGVFSSSGGDTLHLDGALDATGDAGSTLNTTSVTLGRNADSTQYWTGPIALIGIYNGDITADGSWADFESWVTSHYGITIA